MASESDELVDISGVDKYVSQLKTCIDQYQCSTLPPNNGDHITRGTVVYKRFNNVRHYEGAFNYSFKRKQVVMSRSSCEYSAITLDSYAFM